jgi:type VI secretion system secreted protein VgrG
MSGNQTVMTFHSRAVADGTLLVASARGSEALAQPFRFDLELISGNPGLDLIALLQADARVAMNRIMVFGDGRTGSLAYDYHGMLTEIRQVGRTGSKQFRYRAVLRPQLWKLSCTRRSRIFVDKSVPELIKAVFGESGISFKLKLAKESAYPIYRYAVQYEETDLDFISRWMEQVGISYYYDVDGDHGTVVVIDQVRGYAPISPYGEQVPFDDLASAKQASNDPRQRLNRLDLEANQVPRKVQLKDHNAESPDEALFFEAEVDAKGLGTWYEYNSNYLTESEGRFLLGIRREYWQGRRRRLDGEGDHRSFQAGRTFTPTNHYNPGVADRSFVLLEVRHKVSQEHHGEAIAAGTYANEFTAMPAALAYRPERATPWPSIHGVVQAKVSGGAFAYAELDDMGRYKIDADYDASHQTIGKVRMAQPSVGENAGMHFPLRKDTEVLLGHIDGDPDRPIILGAVHDGKKVNLLDKTRDPLGTLNSIRSQGGNLLHLGDDPANKFITLMNGSCNAIQQFGRTGVQDPSAPGSSTSNSGKPPGLPAWMKPPGPAGQKPERPAPGGATPRTGAAGKAAPAPPAPAAPPAPGATPPPPGQAAMLSGDAPARFEDSSAGFVDSVTNQANTSSDAPIDQFWNAVAGHYDDAGENSLNGNPLYAYPGSDPLNPVTDWSTLAYREFAAIWTIPAPVQGTDYDIITQSYPTTNMGAGSLSKDSLGLGNVPDPLTAWIVPRNSPNDTTPPVGIQYPGQQPSFLTQESDWTNHFANFTATAGGSMKFALGEDIEVAHGNQYRYRRGTICNWQIGDLHNMGVNGNTYNYNWGSSEISFNMGPSTVATYNYDSNTEWAYSTGIGNFEYIDGDKNEMSWAKNTTGTETVTGIAKTTSNVGQKQEFEDIGASVALKCGGAQFEMSLNGPKMTIEADLGVEISLSLMLELISLSIEIHDAPKLELEISKTGLHLKKDEMALLKTELTGLMDANALVASKAVAALDDKVGAGMKQVGVALNQGGAEMKTVAAAVATGFKIHL